MPARDPFYTTRAAEIAANTIRSTLTDLGHDIWASMTPFPNGHVVAETIRGNVLTLAWDVEHQCIQTIDQHMAEGAVQVLELAA